MQFCWVSQDFHPTCPIYFDAGYMQLFASVKQSTVKILRLDAASGSAWLPLELTALGNGHWEASSSYGYGGLWSEHLFPVSQHDWRELMSFLAGEKIICAFIRHAPFLQNHLFWPIDRRTPNRKTYARELQPGMTLETLCAGFDQKLRWSVHAAQRAQLQVEFYPATQWQAQDVAEFYQIYRALMAEKNSNAFYRFSEEFFQEHANAFGEQCELALIRDPVTKKIVAGSMFLLDATGWAHYHLSASIRDGNKSQAVELLLAEALVRYANLGYRWLHLGGGHTLDGSDGLSRFKKKFSSTTLDFEISTWVCDEAAYQQERTLQPLTYPACFLIHDARGAL